jgi:hypothetical protein
VPYTEDDWFNELVFTLRKEGYTCKLMNGTKPASLRRANFCLITGKNIRGGFCRPFTGDNPVDRPYPYIDGRICADHSACFDKWSKCPYVQKLPADITQILKHLEYLASEEGRRISETYAYLDSNPWPYEM